MPSERMYERVYWVTLPLNQLTVNFAYMPSAVPSRGLKAR